MEPCFLMNLLTGEKYPLTGDHVIGRSDSCDIVIKTASVSRTHAALKLGESGWTIRDCGSKNGVILNGAYLPPETPVLLHDGDGIMLGADTPLMFIGGEAPAEEEGTVSPGELHRSGRAPEVPRPAPEPRPAPGPAPTREKNAMQRKIQGLRKRFQLCGVGMVVLALLAAVGILLDLPLPVKIIMVCLFVLLGFLYYLRFYTFSSCMSRYGAAELDALLAGEWGGEPAFRESRLWCGERAMFSDRSRVLLPYEGLEWVYIHESHVLGATVSRRAVFGYRDGSSLRADIATGELPGLLRGVILPRRPKLLIGYTPDNQRQYARLTGR